MLSRFFDRQKVATCLFPLLNGAVLGSSTTALHHAFLVFWVVLFFFAATWQVLRPEIKERLRQKVAHLSSRRHEAS